MTKYTNRVVRLRQRPPPGLAGPETWGIHDESARSPGDGEVLVRVRFISIDPPMRHWITEVKAGYFKPVAIGEVMRTGEAIAEVIESRVSGFHSGDLVIGSFGVQRYWTGVPSAVGCYTLDPGPHPPERFLGVLGMSGLTAYFGMLEIGQPKVGETVVVSSAAGVVGALAGQIAKVKGCKVIGVAGGKTKCDYVVNELGFDACVDYKDGPILPMLRDKVGEGIDIFFDNVGGEVLDACLALLKIHARIPISGAIAAYNDITAIQGPRNYLNLRLYRARMEGFMIPDYAARFPEGRAHISQWLLAGNVKAREHLLRGIDLFPEALTMLFTGGNFGKLILEL
jgi:NADPH-dependent curcumin reductase CurA